MPSHLKEDSSVCQTSNFWWKHIYCLQEIKQGDKSRIRSLFARATSLEIPAKKIKFLFKRQMEFEKEHGTPQTVEDVKAAARRYVEENLGA